METTVKSKTRNKHERAKESGNMPENREDHSTRKEKPTEDQIRQKAQEIYNERLVRGEYGNELDDWQRAEKILSES